MMGLKVLSLFDGMACGMIAFKQLGIDIDEYHAYEIDKYAIKTSSHNFPEIIHHGDVFEGDFKEYKDFDYLIGGSPCTHWSIAQSKERRETTASGMGWNLFSQYVRALRDTQPKFFLYENNKSMSREIYKSISDAFGFEPIMINSALVSAQNRQRYYWVGKRNDDGTYSKVDIEQPEDRGILLRDVLDGVTDREKGRAVIGSIGRTTHREYFKKSQGNMTFEPVVLGVAQRGRYIGSKETEQHMEIRDDGKANCVTTVQKDSMICQQVGALPRPNGELSKSQGFRIYSPDGKSVTLKGNSGGSGGKTGLYAIPIEFENGVPIKAMSGADGKSYAVYQVSDGMIKIKDKEYPIKLTDGFYIIRKLTVSECKRLQTVPDWFDFPVSDTQSYKQLGAGWTVEVIMHLLKGTID